jgi:hypothetical protein
MFSSLSPTAVLTIALVLGAVLGAFFRLWVSPAYTALSKQLVTEVVTNGIAAVLIPHLGAVIPGLDVTKLPALAAFGVMFFIASGSGDFVGNIKRLLSGTSTGVAGKIMSWILVGFLAIGLTACASSGVGKAVQAADAQKQLVERAAVEFVKLKLRGDPRITPAVYEQGRAAYEKYQGAQAGLAEALSSWKVVSNPENENKLQAALAEVTKNINFYLALVGKFVNLEDLKKKINAGAVEEIKTTDAAPTWFEIYYSASTEHFTLAAQGRY